MHWLPQQCAATVCCCPPSHSMLLLRTESSFSDSLLLDSSNIWKIRNKWIITCPHKTQFAQVSVDLQYNRCLYIENLILSLFALPEPEQNSIQFSIWLCKKMLCFTMWSSLHNSNGFSWSSLQKGDSESVNLCVAACRFHSSLGETKQHVDVWG